MKQDSALKDVQQYNSTSYKAKNKQMFYSCREDSPTSKQQTNVSKVIIYGVQLSMHNVQPQVNQRIMIYLLQ